METPAAQKRKFSSKPVLISSILCTFSGMVLLFVSLTDTAKAETVTPPVKHCQLQVGKKLYFTPRFLAKFQSGSECTLIKEDCKEDICPHIKAPHPQNVKSNPPKSVHPPASMISRLLHLVSKLNCTVNSLSVSQTSSMMKK